MDLAAFFTLIDTELKQGGRLDSIIPGAVERAAELIEQVNSFQYMSRFVEFTVFDDVGNDRLITLPNKFKAFGSEGFLRLILANGKFRYLLKRPAQTLTEVETGDADYFWLDGDDRIYLDKSVDRDSNFEMAFVGFTPWPTATSETPKLLSKFQGLLYSGTVIQLGPVLRDQFIQAAHEKLYSAALISAQISDEETRHSLEFNEMEYGHTD